MKKSDKPTNKPVQSMDAIPQRKKMAMGKPIPNGKLGNGKHTKP